MDEILELFAQVEMRKWEPPLSKEGHTFPSSSIVLKDPALVQWMFAQFSEIERLIRGAGSSASTVVNQHLDALAGPKKGDEDSSFNLISDLLDKEIKTNHSGGAVMVKFCEVGPKDSLGLDAKRARLYHDFLQSGGMPPAAWESHQQHVQACVRARCHSQCVTSGAEALRLILASTRCADESERRMFADPQELNFHIRSWYHAMDPALEFRVFLNHEGKVGGISQMATMDVHVRYSQLDHVVEFIRQRVRYFLEETATVQTVIKSLLAPGPADQLVVDVVYSFEDNTCKVVEFNPFATSSGGHLYKVWEDKEGKQLRTCANPPELRHWVDENYPRDAIETNIFDPTWKNLVVHSVTHPSRQLSRRIVKEAARIKFVVVAGGKPGHHPDPNVNDVRRECNAFVAAALFYHCCSAGAGEGQILLYCIDGDHMKEAQNTFASAVKCGLLRCEPACKPDVLKQTLGRHSSTAEDTTTILVVMGHGDTDHDQDLALALKQVELGGKDPVTGAPLSATGVHRTDGSERWWVQLRCRRSDEVGQDEAELVTGEDVKQDDERYCLFKPEVQQWLADLHAQSGGSNRVLAFFGFCYSCGLVPAALPDGSHVIASALPDCMATAWSWSVFRAAYLNTVFALSPGALVSGDGCLWNDVLAHMKRPPLRDASDAAQLTLHGQAGSCGARKASCGSIRDEIHNDVASRLVHFQVGPDHTVKGLHAWDLFVGSAGLASAPALLSALAADCNFGNTSSVQTVVDLLEFVQCEGKPKFWDPENWNDVFQLALAAPGGIAENPRFVEQLIDWREMQTSAAGGGEHEAVELGDLGNAVKPFWSQDHGSLTFSLEVEGCGLGILNLYRPENVPEDQWTSKSLTERSEMIHYNWALLKKRLKSVGSEIRWLNNNLTIEDIGFLWEVSYGGESKGYSVDLDHILEQVSLVESMGISVGDREHDSGVQLHVAFGGLFDESVPVVTRQFLVSFAVYLDDYLFLRDFSKMMLDDCNNLWALEDYTPLLDNCKNGGEAEFSRWLSPGDSGKSPNLRTKHKHIGIRGIDCYKAPGVYGLEVRRGNNTEQLYRVLPLIASVLSESDTPVKLHTQRVSKTDPRRAAGVSRSSILGWLHRTTRFALHEDTFTGTGENAEGDVSNALSHLGFDDVRRQSQTLMGNVTSLVGSYVDGLCEWSDFLHDLKQRIWGSGAGGGRPAEKVDGAKEQFVAKSTAKSLQRVFFVLLSRWEQHPSASGSSLWSASALKEERKSLIERILKMPPVGAPFRKCSAVELRSAVTDFAYRLATLF